jgi:hypothetical protein
MTFNLDTKVLTDEIKKAIADAMPVTAAPATKMISKAELARALDISESGVDQLRRDGILKGYRLGTGLKSPVRFILDEVIKDIKIYNEKNK